MALTRAQLLQGNSSQGAVLPGQVQAVTAGSGVQINGSGVLSINSSDPSFNGFIKTNNSSAYNGYVWPAGPLPTRAQLQTDSSGNLFWNPDTDGIAWTAKGQLVVGTGVYTDTILNVGANTSILVANSGTTSGLTWSDSSTAAALMPAGVTTSRPPTLIPGQLRYNSTNNEFEGYQGATPAWSYLSSMPTGPVDAVTGATNKIFYQNAQVVVDNYTVSTTSNSMSAGPITIATGKTVTIPTGAVWTIV